MRLILILDGFGYDVVKRYTEAGGFKGFNGPSAVVAPYPSMTDLCIEDLVGGEPCEGLEAKRYVIKENRVRGGNLAYLLGQNQPYRAKLDYRAASWLDALCYVAPWLAFKLELKRLKTRFVSAKKDAFIGYLVTTAGIGTKYGAAGQNICLNHIEELCAELSQTEPKLRITLVSDHGHGYVRSDLYDINRRLKELSWRPRRSLDDTKDVVYPAFGLVHCAGFNTKQPERLAQDLSELPCTELVSHKAGDKLAILAKGKKGYVWKNGEAFTYLNVTGDPLDLDLADGDELEMGADGWLNKSLEHRYPCAPERLWRAHTDLVQNAPDVILAIKDGYFFGSKLLAKFAHVESTHGGLNRSNSLAFMLDNRYEMPTVVRSRDALK